MISESSSVLGTASAAAVTARSRRRTRSSTSGSRPSGPVSDISRSSASVIARWSPGPVLPPFPTPFEPSSAGRPAISSLRRRTCSTVSGYRTMVVARPSSFSRSAAMISEADMPFVGLVTRAVPWEK
ncbi:hypothetical protein B6264_26920 [Kitasatospora aureofaciens]|nr:hypothetical protein B6264_26920 [Kitasatospora aureofaciens]